MAVLDVSGTVVAAVVISPGAWVAGAATAAIVTFLILAGLLGRRIERRQR